MHRLVPTGLLPVLFFLAAPGAATVVTETEFLAALDDVHPAVAERSQAVALARARVIAAATLANPILGVAREDVSGPTEEMDWTISWQLPERSRRLAVAGAQEAVGAAEARLDQDLRGLRLAMKELYAEWAAAAARRGRLAALAERIAALAERETARAERGEASGLEARRLDLAAAGLRARLALAAAAAEEARARARSWHPSLPPDAQPALPPLPPAPELEGDHPLLRAARADLEAAILERRVAGRSLRSPEVLAGWKREKEGQASLDGPVLGLSWSVPLFARNEAEQAAADAEVAAARARLELTRREVESARAAALAAYRRLAAAVAETRAALDGNDRMLAGAEAAFRQGEASLTDLLETLRSTADSEDAALDLHEAALAAHRELERLAGSGGPADPSTDPDSQESSP